MILKIKIHRATLLPVVLYTRETWCLALEGNTENRVLWRIDYLDIRMRKWQKSKFVPVVN
jgi:hypothetical protein